MDKEPITVKGLENLKSELIDLKNSFFIMSCSYPNIMKKLLLIIKGY